MTAEGFRTMSHTAHAVVDALSAVFHFRPLPFLHNPHVQTVLAHLLPGAHLRPARRQVVWLPDGDALVLHDNVPPGWRPGEPIAVLVHGLSGSHASRQVRRLARMFLARRVRSVRLDLRGAGQAALLARRSYHGGCSDDLRTALAEVHRWGPASPLLVLGVSLGGNIALKMAGEMTEHPVPGLARIAALGPPIDLERCAALLAQPHNRLYENVFLRDLMGELRQRQRNFPDLRPVRFPRRLTMRLFDELYTAPTCGFADALDYYRRASSVPVLSRIGVPTLILTARDDPFIAVEPFEETKFPALVTLRIVPHGGHVGFLGWDGAGGFCWGERRMVDWLLHPLA